MTAEGMIATIPDQSAPMTSGEWARAAVELAAAVLHKRDHRFARAYDYRCSIPSTDCRRLTVKAATAACPDAASGAT